MYVLFEPIVKFRRNHLLGSDTEIRNTAEVDICPIHAKGERKIFSKNIVMWVPYERARFVFLEMVLGET